MWVHVLTSTHNLCFGAEIRKIGIPLHTPVVGIKGVFNTHICYPDICLLFIEHFEGKHLSAFTFSVTSTNKYDTIIVLPSKISKKSSHIRILH